VTALLAAVDPWRWQPHLEVWFLVVAALALGLYAVRVIGPKVVPPGEPVVSGRQTLSFGLAIAVLWVSSDWPMHDIAEEHLYLAHMVQHFLLTLVLPPLLLMATPAWLARLLLDSDGTIAVWVRRLTRPVPAMVLFFAAVVFSHWPPFVNLSVEVGAVHYLAHLLLVVVAVGAWMPVCGPIPERRISLPAQMLYLFIMSILPTVPSAWLILAEHPVYRVYGDGPGLWGLDPVTDQQSAGLFMKLFGGIYLWTLITTIFFTWAGRDEEADRRGRVADRAPARDEAPTGDVLTWDQVERELEAVGPPTREP
jgi:putative membrane protein